MSRTEKTFQGEIKRSLSDLEAPHWYRKIPDLGLRNPFDAKLAYKGTSYALEYKIVKNSKTINLHSLFKNRWHEVENLEAYHKTENRSFVIINMYKEKEYNYAILLEWNQIVTLFNSHDGKIKASELENWRIDRFDGKWDVNCIVQRNYDHVQIPLKATANKQKWMGFDIKSIM